MNFNIYYKACQVKSYNIIYSDIYGGIYDTSALSMTILHIESQTSTANFHTRIIRYSLRYSITWKKITPLPKHYPILRAASAYLNSIGYGSSKPISMTTPQQYVIKKRITEASRLLSFGTAPIEEIAARFGFSNQYYFMNTFKKIQGVTPTEYRKRHLFQKTP